MIEVDELAQYDLFRELNQVQLGKVAGCCQVAHFGADAVVFGEGDPATHLFLVRSGRVGVQIQAAPDHRVNVLAAGRGASVGWSALVPPYRMTATCVAFEPATMIMVDGERLRELCRRDTQLGFQIMCQVSKVIEGRLHDTRLELCNLIYWIRQ